MGGRCCNNRTLAVGNFEGEEGEGEKGDAGSAQTGRGLTVKTANKGMFALKFACGISKYGMVWKALKKGNQNEYAVKVMEKATIYNMRSVDCVLNELNLLSKIRFPYIVNLHYAF